MNTSDGEGMIVVGRGGAPGRFCMDFGEKYRDRQVSTRAIDGGEKAVRRIR